MAGAVAAGKQRLGSAPLETVSGLLEARLAGPPPPDTQHRDLTPGLTSPNIHHQIIMGGRETVLDVRRGWRNFLIEGNLAQRIVNFFFIVQFCAYGMDGGVIRNTSL